MASDIFPRVSVIDNQSRAISYSAPMKVAKLKSAISAAIVASAAISGHGYASGVLSFTDITGPVSYAEPLLGSSQIVNIGVSFVPNAESLEIWSSYNLGCEISGTVAIVDGSATNGADYRVPAELSFSLTSNAISSEGLVEFQPAQVDIPFEILADSETEADETVVLDITDVRALCSGEDEVEFTDDRTADIFVDSGIDQVEYGYGATITITDTFNEEPVEPIDNPGNDELLIRHASLSAQIQEMANLTVHTGMMQTRRLGAELSNLRKGKRGLNIDNLQVKVDNKILPLSHWNKSYAESESNERGGSGAGDPIADFGRWGVFASGAIEFGEQTNSTDNNEYDSAIIILGADYHVNDHFVAGAALGYTSLGSEIGDEVATTDFDKISYFGFLSYYMEDFYFDFILGYGGSEYELERKVESDNVSADTDGSELNASFGAGYQVNLNTSAFNFFGLLNYIDAGVNAYQEETDGIELTSSVDDFDMQSLVSNIGVEFSFNINTSYAILSPQFTLAWEHQFEGDPVSITGNFVGEATSEAFEFKTNELDSDYYTAQVGLTAAFTHGISSYITYDTYVDRDDLKSEMFSFGIRGQF